MEQYNFYNVDPHIAEVYDQIEDDESDVYQIRHLIGSKSQLRILEPFCGTGRIAIPLAKDGHFLVGIDQAKAMLQCAALKIANSGLASRISLIEQNVTEGSWPRGFDLVILGRNSLYELATQEQQEKCFESASLALKKGGHIYVDNNHMEGDLDQTWRDLKSVKTVLSGKCEDGTVVDGKMQTIWFDAPKRLVRLKRLFRIEDTNGKVVVHELTQQKHPVSSDEIREWLIRYGFGTLKQFGEYIGNLYNTSSPRAIFWAYKIG